MKILHLVPRLPPAIDGIGDFAELLAQELSHKEKVENFFLLCDPRAPRDEGKENIAQLHSRSTQELLALLPAKNIDIVLLHYVGYGYARRGCPYWLERALHLWKKQTPHIQLVTLFHELFAHGPPWTSAFWLGPFQRKLAQTLSKRSALSVTSTSLFARQLSCGGAQKKSFLIQPVFSTLGEPEQVLPYEERKARLIIFGSPAHRERIYQSESTALKELIHKGYIKEIIDIGKALPQSPQKIFGLSPLSTGILSRHEASSFIGESRFGAVEYAPCFLGKSTVFSVFCAHACCPLLVGAGETPAGSDGLLPGVHYLNAPSHCSEAVISKVIRNSSLWYADHTLARYAQGLLSSIKLLDKA